ncbi:hypothetical protein PCA20602_01546 [Pandoraea capi]|uniref:Uncharacterized protein n=1 Tax=Pandoraea capi TaxID=2508286 RepID=A0ABY6VU92_9BURK|nr:hypothetical protein [Pandoraea capi]VVD89482.1 hypothetical protein PCA20602_01546 [Pandoraea capi]
MTLHLPATSLAHSFIDKLSNLSERILALTTCTVTDTGKAIPHRFLLAIFEELGDMTVELVCECQQLKVDTLDA